MSYIGRFAPSPSGPLHFGSLVAALGSYLQAKSEQGKWLVRIEDIDPPREVPGAADDILRTLEAFGLYWDDTVLYQSQRLEVYQEQIDQWIETGSAYLCQCTRKQIKEQGGYYQGHCRTLNHEDPNDKAVRLVMQHPIYQFNDIKHGNIDIAPQLAEEDFIIKRRDGLFAYNLAVVLDDIYQGITEIVRGADLIEPTGRHISLYHTLSTEPVRYLHLPLALDCNGNKLSKQNHATAIDSQQPIPSLIKALQFLGMSVPAEMTEVSIEELLSWAIQNWRIDTLPNQLQRTPKFSNG